MDPSRISAVFFSSQYHNLNRCLTGLLEKMEELGVVRVIKRKAVIVNREHCSIG